MTLPAARVGDKHECRKLDPDTCCGISTTKQHKGLEIQPPGVPTVLIDNKPAAKCGDKVGCIGTPSVDVIVTGCATVKIMNQLAAVKGSLCSHDGTVIEGSGTVFYDTKMEGATFGDHTAATAACNEALKSRRNLLNGNKDPKMQGFDKNCGLETARQLCIQKCNSVKGTDPNHKACDACKESEADWYRNWLAKNREKINEASDARAKANQKTWTEVRQSDRPVEYYDPKLGKWLQVDKIHSSENWNDLPPNFNKYTMRYASRFPGDPPAPIDVERPDAELKPEQVPPPGQPDDGKWDPNVGSDPDQRAAVLKERCGIESHSGPNDPENMAAGLEDGPIIASVDVNVLDNGMKPGEKPRALHAVTVTQMQYGPDGKLQTVWVNDTADPNTPCGKPVPGQLFKDSLTQKPAGYTT